MSHNLKREVSGIAPGREPALRLAGSETRPFDHVVICAGVCKIRWSMVTTYGPGWPLSGLGDDAGRCFTAVFKLRLLAAMAAIRPARAVLMKALRQALVETSSR